MIGYDLVPLGKSTVSFNIDCFSPEFKELLGWTKEKNDKFNARMKHLRRVKNRQILHSKKPKKRGFRRRS